jgi:hypothetical protein
MMQTVRRPRFGPRNQCGACTHGWRHARKRRPQTVARGPSHPSIPLPPRTQRCSAATDFAGGERFQAVPGPPPSAASGRTSSLTATQAADGPAHPRDGWEEGTANNRARPACAPGKTFDDDEGRRRFSAPCRPSQIAGRPHMPVRGRGKRSGLEELGSAWSRRHAVPFVAHDWLSVHNKLTCTGMLNDMVQTAR